MTAGAMPDARRDHVRRRVLVLASLGLLAAVALHLCTSPQAPGALGVLRALAGAIGLGEADPIDQYVVTRIRLPRVLLAAFAGASLALAGAVMQAAFRNPLAAPDVVGTSAGAAFGGAIAIVYGLATVAVLAVPAVSMLGALSVTWVVFALGGTGARFSTTGLLLAGVAMNTLVGALTAFVVTLNYSNYEASSAVLFWLMGGLDGKSWTHAAIAAGGFVLFAALVVVRSRELDVLTLRDETAHSLGVDGKRARRWLLGCACGLTAAAVANTGGIAFVGLVVPQLARLLVGPGHGTLLPASALLGALLLVLADVLVRVSPPDMNLRLGVVTAILGAPWFLHLLARHRRGEALA